MEQTHKAGAIDFTVTPDGKLEYCISVHASKEAQLSPQEALDFIMWLVAHQNYFALAKIHEDQRVAMLAEITGITEEEAQHV